MTDHRNPLERKPDQAGTAPDSATPGTSSIGDDAGMWADDVDEAARDLADDAESGRDAARSAAIEQSSSDGSRDAPPAAYRPDSVVRAVSPEARVEMERGDSHRNEANFTKGRNAPTADQMQGSSKSVDATDEYLYNAPRGIFPNTPGGAGATPLAAARRSFLSDVASIGHFPSMGEAERWTRAVFNTLRHRAVEVDDDLAAELASMVRVGEAPEVQVEEMRWGGDWLARFSQLVCLLQNWKRDEFYQQLAEQAGETADDPWVDAAVYSFFGALKRAMDDDADRVSVGELQEAWNKA
jgi:uncharacterized protein (DUF2267 family)